MRPRLELAAPDDDSTGTNYGCMLFENTTSIGGCVVVNILGHILYYRSTFMPCMMQFFCALPRWTDDTKIRPREAHGTWVYCNAYPGCGEHFH